MKLQLATREKVKIRMSVSAPTGFGKTYGALLIAYGITGDWGKIAVIDTENRSASLYAHLGPFYTIPIEPPFTTDKYIQAIGVCEKGGIEVIVIDSATHVWSGQGGLLEFNNSLGGKYQDWAKTTPLYQKWLNAILHSSCHVISTMRKKQAYAMVQDGGKSKVEKKGLEDEIRGGFDYEMTIAFEIVNDNHLAKASKDRTGLFDGKPEFVLTDQVGKDIRAWCETGADTRKSDQDSLLEEINQSQSVPELVALYKANKVTVDATPGLQQAMAARRDALTPPKADPLPDPQQPAATADKPAGKKEANKPKSTKPADETPAPATDGTNNN